jgi:hypothetical protein
MTPIAQDPESLRHELEGRLEKIMRDLKLSGWNVDRIRREMHAAIDRITS